MMEILITIATWCGQPLNSTGSMASTGWKYITPSMVQSCRERMLACIDPLKLQGLDYKLANSSTQTVVFNCAKKEVFK